MNPFNVLIRPILSEKSNGVRENQGKYTFQIDMRAGKEEVAYAIEKIYNVKVAGVQTLIKRGRERRRGIHIIPAAKMKKAVVTLVEGAKLPIFEDQ